MLSCWVPRKRPAGGQLMTLGRSLTKAMEVFRLDRARWPGIGHCPDPGVTGVAAADGLAGRDGVAGAAPAAAARGGRAVGGIAAPAGAHARALTTPASIWPARISPHHASTFVAAGACSGAFLRASSSFSRSADGFRSDGGCGVAAAAGAGVAAAGAGVAALRAADRVHLLQPLPLPLLLAPRLLGLGQS